MATHSSTLAWKIPWTEESGRLQSMGLLRVGHDFTLTFHFHTLEKEMATHSSILAWKIPWTEESGRLQSMGSEYVCAQLCPILCNPMDYSLPDSSVHGIFQAIVLEWIAISFSRVYGGNVKANVFWKRWKSKCCFFHLLSLLFCMWNGNFCKTCKKSA